MTREEWIKIFEEIHNRKPKIEEILEAGRNGEYVGEKVIFCHKCGTPDSIGSETCQNCGSRLISNNKNKSFSITDSILFSYLRFCIRHGRWALPIYFVVVISFGLYIGLGLLPGIIGILTAMYLVSEKGQTLVCKLIGGERIERTDYIQNIQEPIMAIITRARKEGLQLPENIELYLIESEIPNAYAVGMNRIVVSENLVENPKLLELKIMFELHRIHNMSPNLLLVVVGSNLLLVFCCLILMAVGAFDKNYGDRRKSFWTGNSQAREGALLFYSLIGFLLLVAGATFLFVQSVVRKDVELSDRYVASQGFGEIHCQYIAEISKQDNSTIKDIFELGYPEQNKRIAMMQKEFGVKYDPKKGNNNA